MPSTRIADLRAAVAEASGRLAAEGLLIDTSGNVSARADDLVAVTATGAVLGTTRPDQITVVDLDGTVVAGELAPTSELALHLGVYRRYGTSAVVHTHSPMATALSLVLDELPCVHYQLLELGGTIRVAPFAPFGTSDLAENVLAALDGKNAALMANHGAVTHAATLEEAVSHAIVLEWACGIYQRAAAVGTPRALDVDQQAAARKAAADRRYGHTKRLRG